MNLINRKFGRWEVVEKTNERISGSIVWKCICDCGNYGKVRTAILTNGESKSCGCLRRDKFKEIGKSNLKHGHARRKLKSSTYKSWERIKQRCLNSNNKNYNLYGGRGITICERWKKFENFLADMGERPEGYEIHRLNNEKGYYLKNCEWKEKSKHVSDHKIDINIKRRKRRNVRKN